LKVPGGKIVNRTYLIKNDNIHAGKKEVDMTEYKIITLPKTMSLSERISGVSEEISKWLESLEEPFNVNTDVMHLAKYERNDKYNYHYILDRAVKDPDKKTVSRKSVGNN
jgi:hypothetical protein